MSELERLTKAEQTAGQFLADLREVHCKTDNVALEEIMIEAIDSTVKILRRLRRCGEQAKRDEQQ